MSPHPELQTSGSKAISPFFVYPSMWSQSASQPLYPLHTLLYPKDCLCGGLCLSLTHTRTHAHTISLTRARAYWISFWNKRADCWLFLLSTLGSGIQTVFISGFESNTAPVGSSSDANYTNKNELLNSSDILGGIVNCSWNDDSDPSIGTYQYWHPPPPPRRK